MAIRDMYIDENKMIKVAAVGRDSGNDFCRFSFLGYPKRNDFVPSRTQKCLFSVGSEKYTTRKDQKRTN